MRPVVLLKTLAAADVDIIAVAQALAAAGNLTLVTATVTLDTGRRVSILSSGNDSALTWTVVGTNDAGSAISETVAGGNAVAVETLQDFLTVSRVSANGAVAGTVDVGTSSTGSTPWQVPNAHITPFELAVSFDLMSGAVTGTFECTDDTPLAPMYIYQPGYSQALPVPTPFPWPGMAGVAADAQGVVNRPIAAWRWTTTAGVGVAKITARQSGIRN